MTTEDTNRLLQEISVNNCQKSFRRLFDHYYPRMFEVAKFYVRITHLAEEVVSDVFIKFWKNRSDIEKIKNIRSYLFIAVKRQSLNVLRQYNPNLFYIDSLEHELTIESNNPEKNLHSEEYLDYISRCIQNLPEKCRIVFKMIKEDRMTYKQVSEVTGLSVKTIEMHVCNALKKLKVDINKYKNYHQTVNVK